MSDNGGGFWWLLILPILGYAAFHYYVEHESPTLEQQRACAEQSEKFFKRKYDSTSSFFDHFSPAQNRCFIHVITVDAPEGGQSLTVRKDIFDAFEGVSFGAIESISDLQNHADAVNECSAILADGKKQDCHSEDEWRALTKYTQ